MTAKAIQVVSPVGGWNTRDALDQMPAEDAVVLTNWFPTVGRVQTRKGYISYASGMAGSVETLAEFNAGATRKFIAASNNEIYDISLPGAVGAALAGGFQNNRWSYSQFDDATGGARMALVNGIDLPQMYNGTSISALTVSGTDLTINNLVGVFTFKNRSFFWEKDSQDFWYSAVGALGGALNKFPLGRVSGFGGNLIAMQSWTVDGGDGVDDLAVFIMSSGDVIIYQGGDPGSAADWALVGIFRLGAPLAARGALKVGSDVVIMTKDGYVPLSRVLDVGRVTSNRAISDKINGAVKEAASLYEENFGWQALMYPQGNYLLFNVPVSNTRYDQHIFNTLTNTWTKFEGLNGVCWSLYNDKLYFGGIDGNVYLADAGYNDNGNPITFSAQTAWNYLNFRGQIKRFTALKPVFESEGGLPISLALAFDFEVPAATYSVSNFSGNAPEWDNSPWDISPWAGENTIIRPWVSVAGIGLNVSTRVIATLSQQSCKWFSLEYLFEPAGYV